MTKICTSPCTTFVRKCSLWLFSPSLKEYENELTASVEGKEGEELVAKLLDDYINRNVQTLYRPIGCR